MFVFVLLLFYVNRLTATLKAQSKRPTHSNTATVSFSPY